jgi:glyoxylase-like metal-dependent hydrolase (beta-lactamase superfamily II)
MAAYATCPNPLLRAAAGAWGLLLRQCFDADTGTYTDLLADPASAEGVLIDPVFSQHGRDLALIRELGISLVATLDTHVHADHVSGAWLLQRATGCAIGLAERAGAENVTLPLVEGVGCASVRVIWRCWLPPATPLAASPSCSTTNPPPSPGMPC